LVDHSQPGTAYETGWDTSWTGEVNPTDAALGCGSQFETWTVSPAGNEDRPINCANWFEAYAFCIWDGGFLPSETEWLNAYHGGGGTSGQREFPWSVPSSSTTITPALASYWVDETQQCKGDGVNGCTLDDIHVVGSKPAGNGRFGHSDLSGNMGEWMLDWYNSTALEGGCLDCAYLTGDGSTRVLPGGAFSSTVDLVSHWYRLNALPDNRYYIGGLRCARSPI
jgi:formylglycine-generating enzyme required for sulfatase activity